MSWNPVFTKGFDVISADIKVWESSPIGFASFREKVMAFCYENKCAPDDLLIAPYVEQIYGDITSMGLRITFKPNPD